MAAVLPNNFRGTETSVNMKSAGRAFGQFVSPVERIELWDIMNVAEHDDNPISVGAGTADLAELNSSECSGFLLNANDETYGHLWFLPSNISMTEDMKFRVSFTNSASAGTGAALFVLKYTALTAGTTAVGVGATALSTAITSTTDLGANILTWTAWGTLDGSTLTNVPGEDALVLKTYVTLDTITDATALQLQAEYRRRFI